MIRLFHFWISHFRTVLVLVTILAFVAGAGITSLMDAMVEPLQIHHITPAIVFWNKYLAIEIDRTRLNYCHVTASRVLFQEIKFGGENMQVVLPVTSQTDLLPDLGRKKFLLLLIKTADVPSGDWYIRTTQRENCSWLDELTGGTIVMTNPVEVKIP